MAVLKAGSTVGGLAMLLLLKPSNLTEGAGEVNQFLGVDYDNTIKFLSYFKSQAQGTVAGFTSGGYTTLQVATINKFPFSSPFTTAASAGNLSQARTNAAGQSSSTQGFTSGGYGTAYVDTIDKFPFTAPFTTAASAGDLSQARRYGAGQSSSTEGFTSGGLTPTVAATIDKFPFTAPFTTAASAGNLSQARSGGAGQSSSTEGFTSGGGIPAGPVGPVDYTTIYKFPFSAPFTTATSAGDLSQARAYAAGQSSSTEGFTSGGLAPQNVVATIDKFPFSAPFTTAASAGNLSQARSGGAGQQY